MASWKTPEKDGEYGWATSGDTYTTEGRGTMADVV